MARERTGRKPQNKTRVKKAGTKEKRIRKPSPLAKWLEFIFHAGLIGFLLFTLAGTMSARRTALENASQLASQHQELLREKAMLQEELDRFNDPEWREAYWKWRTMRHVPGEYYINFVEPGVM